MTKTKYKNQPFELLGYKRKINSQKVIWNILYDIYNERERNKKSSLEIWPIIDLKKKYKISFESLHKYLPERIKRESLDNNKKVVKLYWSDLKYMKQLVELYETMATLSEEEIKIVKYMSIYLFSLV